MPTSTPRNACSRRWSARRRARRPATRFRKKLREGELDDKEIEIEVADTGTGGMPSFDIPGMPGANIGVLNINDMLQQGDGRPAHQDAQDHRQGILRRC